MSVWRGWAFVVLAGLLALSGCSGQDAPGQNTSAKSPTGATPESSANDAEPVGNTYAERHQRDVLRCLREAGWEAKYNSSDNTIFLDKVPPEQQEARAADEQRCSDEASAKNPMRPLTDADYKSLYQQELKAMKCLEAEGYPPNRQPISEQQYVSEYKTGAPSWQAYTAVGPIPPEIEKKCPQPSVEQ